MKGRFNSRLDSTASEYNNDLELYSFTFFFVNLFPVFQVWSRFLIFWSYPGEAGQMKLTLTVGEQKLKVSPWKSASTSLTSPCIVASTNKFFWSIFQKFGYFSEFFNQNYLIVRIFFLLLFLYVSLVFFPNYVELFQICQNIEPLEYFSGFRVFFQNFAQKRRELGSQLPTFF